MIDLRSASALFVLLTVVVNPAQAQAQAPVPAPVEKLSWYGDPKAPDISGVWVRDDQPGVNGNAASKEGWMPWPPPLKGDFAQIWKKRIAQAAAGQRTDDPVEGCQPGGMPRVMTGMTGPMLLIQTPGRITIYRDGIPVRRIWLDGHPFPDPKDLESFSNGNARGHYEGGDLVTEVIGIKDQPIDSTGIPHSDALKIVERFHRVDPQTLKVSITLTDPVAYSKAMKTTVIFKKYGDPMWEPKEFICRPKTGYHPEAYVH